MQITCEEIEQIRDYWQIKSDNRPDWIKPLCDMALASLTMQDEVTALKKCLQDCIGTLEPEIEHTYGMYKEYPKLCYKYDREMQVVIDAKALLKSNREASHDKG